MTHPVLVFYARCKNVKKLDSDSIFVIIQTTFSGKTNDLQKYTNETPEHRMITQKKLMASSFNFAREIAITLNIYFNNYKVTLDSLQFVVID